MSWKSGRRKEVENATEVLPASILLLNNDAISILDSRRVVKGEEAVAVGKLLW